MIQIEEGCSSAMAGWSSGIRTATASPIIEEGRASAHPPLPGSGRARRRLDGPGDAEAVIELFAENYRRVRARD